MDNGIELYIAQLNEISAHLAEQKQEIQEIKTSMNAEFARRMDQIERDRRSGKYGDDWRILQQRIDLGQTTEDAIQSGEDSSAEAIAVRKMLHTNCEEISKLMNEDEDFDRTSAESWQELAKRLQRLHPNEQEWYQ